MYFSFFTGKRDHVSIIFSEDSMVPYCLRASAQAYLNCFRFGQSNIMHLFLVLAQLIKFSVHYTHSSLWKEHSDVSG